jgi:excinuclease UvrABC nuclease subunit
MPWIFRAPQPFNDAAVREVPAGPGVYIIYKGEQPFYIGRSRVSIRERLWRHLHNGGSQKVAAELKSHLTFEYEEMWSESQAEAQLIEALGTVGLGNLRSESDPADWE